VIPADRHHPGSSEGAFGRGQTVRPPVAASFRVDVMSQARALRGFGRAPVSLGLYALLRREHDRIVLTGSGASHLAAVPSWHRLVAGGRTAVWTDARHLIDSPSLITADSLLVTTSRSGMSTWVIDLLTRFTDRPRPAGIIAVTDDVASPLAAAADGEILLRSQSSQSPKGFLNALAAHDYIASMILGEDNDDIASTARVVAATTCPADVLTLASDTTAGHGSRLAYIGFGEHAATSLYAALLTREVTPISAMGYASNEFGHDMVAAADSSLTAVLFAGRARVNNDRARALASDLARAGARVLVVGDGNIDQIPTIQSPAGHLSAQVAHSVMIAEHFVSSLAA
jgi:fructoselysine-6-P-deglycase FrlB-like protein